MLDMLCLVPYIKEKCEFEPFLQCVRLCVCVCVCLYVKYEEVSLYEKNRKATKAHVGRRGIAPWMEVSG